MNKILTITPSVKKIEKQVTSITHRNNKLQNSTNIQKWHFDYSTEEHGYFTRRDSMGNILEVIRTIFTR